MPPVPDTGQYRGKTPLPSESSRTTCSQSRLTSANHPPSQDVDVTQFPTPAEATRVVNTPNSSPAQKGKLAQSPSTLHKIVTALEDLLSKYPLLG